MRAKLASKPDVLAGCQTVESSQCERWNNCDLIDLDFFSVIAKRLTGRAGVELFEEPLKVQHSWIASAHMTGSIGERINF